MKTACFFFACLLAVALAGQEEDDAASVKAVTECKKEMGFAAPNMDKTYDDGVSEEDKPCFDFCILKKLKLMNEDGTVNKAAMIAIYDSQSEKDRVDKALSNCEKTVQPVDGCKMATCLHSISQRKPKKPVQ